MHPTAGLRARRFSCASSCLHIHGCGTATLAGRGYESGSLAVIRVFWAAVSITFLFLATRPPLVDPSAVVIMALLVWVPWLLVFGADLRTSLRRLRTMPHPFLQD